MPVQYACLGCQGSMGGPCGTLAVRSGSCGAGPCCVHAVGVYCRPCGETGCMHGARGGVAGSYFSCGHSCVGGCVGGLCGCCYGPAWN